MKNRKLKDTLLTVGEELLNSNVRQKTFLLIESVVILVVAIIASIFNFVKDVKILGYLTLAFSIIFLGFTIVEFILFKRKKEIRNDLFVYINFGLTYIFVIFYLIFGPKNGLYFYWMVSLPLVIPVVGGTKKGIIYSLFLLVIVILFFYIPGWMMGDEIDSSSSWNTFRILFIVNFGITALLGVTVAIINDWTIRRLGTLNEKYYQEANTDITTGLKNQLFFITYVRELTASLKEGDRIGFMFIDIDDFKIYNDKYGHMVGNEVLINVANKLNEIPHDLLVRWGGDEFAIIERNISKEEFLAKANYLLKSVEAMEGGVTISIGLDYYIVDENFDFDKIFNEADMKTISAKGKGKNCIVFNNK